MYRLIAPVTIIWGLCVELGSRLYKQQAQGHAGTCLNSLLFWRQKEEVICLRYVQHQNGDTLNIGDHQVVDCAHSSLASLSKQYIEHGH